MSKAVERMEKIFEDEEVEVYKGFTDEEVEELIEELLSERPMTLAELRDALRIAVSDERLRWLLKRMVERRKVFFDPRSKVYFGGEYV